MGSADHKKKPKPVGRRLAVLMATALILGIGAAAVLQGVRWYQADEFSNRNSAVASKPIDELAGENSGDAENIESVVEIPEVATGAEVSDVSNVVDNVMPAVVAINCETVTKSVSYDFFGRAYEREKQGSSSGTGIIVGQNNTELLIVTNNHVIENASRVAVKFCNEQSAEAEIKGCESGNDLAVIAIRLRDLTKETLSQIRLATMGDSDKVRMGEFVIAIGNALGYGQSVTVGYVSALDREVTTDNVSLHLIQVDAAINPGNSGGALLNANGEVIGINSVKYSDTAVERVGYAIPISEVIPIINELMTREQLAEGETAYLGIVGKNISSAHASSFKMPLGIYISEIAPDSPAEQAGLRVGDIIVGINGRSIKTMEELVEILGYTRGGTHATLQMKVLENGSYVDKELNILLGYRRQASED